MEGFDQVVFFKFLAALIALVNPLYGLPIFISFTNGYTTAERRRTAMVVTLSVAVTALIAVVVGEEILSVFGISIPAFRVAGGIIIFGIGLSMLNARGPAAISDQPAADLKARRSSLAVVPLAIPLTFGPGAIVTSIVFAHQLDTRAELASLVPAVFVVALVVGGSLLFAAPITKLLGNTAISLLTRIMGIVLTAVAVEMVLTGLGDAIEYRFPALVAPTSG
ncbi:MAG: NAAT family transporter [Rhodobacteraceae bacterium]|nr:NAAT family transporter [Paracoccaceae bacterium]